MKKSYIIIGVVVIVMLVAIGIYAVINSNSQSKKQLEENSTNIEGTTNTENSTKENNTENKDEYIQNNQISNESEENNMYSTGKHHAEIVVKNYGTIVLELDADVAPITVENFANLVNEGFYNGLTFHRIISGFMIQGGDANGDGSGSPKLSDLGLDVSGDNDKSYCIKGEFLSNGYNKNTLKHKEGVISMARADYTQTYSKSLTTESYNSAGSQFFINTASNTSLDGSYATFGKVIEGMDIVHKIEKVEVKEKESTSSSSDSSSSEQKEKSTPVNDVIISKVSVETYGVDYGKPETLDTWNYNDWVYKTYGINLNQYQQ